MARRKPSGTLTLTRYDAADTAALVALYISTGRLKVTKCPEFVRRNLNPKRGGGMMPGHLNPLTMGDPL